MLKLFNKSLHCIADNCFVFHVFDFEIHDHSVDSGNAFFINTKSHLYQIALLCVLVP
jgi:hypothetical protein